MNKHNSGESLRLSFINILKENKTASIIVAAVLAVLVVVSVALALLASGALDKADSETYPPLSPSELAEPKDDNFDIMEYDEYLNCNRVVILEDKNSGVSQSIDDDTYKNHGEGVAVVYEMLMSLIAGDVDTYNSLVSEDAGHYDSFTQQQIYDMRITRVSQGTVQGKSGSYDEYVFTLEYKIRENNGSYKNNLPSDTARPVTVVVNDSSGKLIVASISEPVYVKK